MDLGASYPAALRRVVLPLLGPTLLAAWLTCFIVSFDEVAPSTTSSSSGGDPTPLLVSSCYGHAPCGGGRLTRPAGR